MASLSIFRLCFCPVETKRRVIEVDDLMLISRGPQEVCVSRFFYVPDVGIKVERTPLPRSPQGLLHLVESPGGSPEEGLSIPGGYKLLSHLQQVEVASEEGGV